MATERRAVLASAGPSHYVIKFDVDQCIACLPKKRVLKPSNPSVGSSCTVRWSDGLEYTAKVLAMGNEATAKRVEMELSTELDKENEPSNAKRRKVTKTPSRRPAASTQARQGKKRQPLRSNQSAQKESADFELGPPAPGLLPPAQPKEKEPGVTTDSVLTDSAMSAEIPLQNLPGVATARVKATGGATQTSSAADKENAPMNPPDLGSPETTSSNNVSLNPPDLSDSPEMTDGSTEDIPLPPEPKKVITISVDDSTTESGSGCKCACHKEILEKLDLLTCSVTLLDDSLQDILLRLATQSAGNVAASTPIVPPTTPTLPAVVLPTSPAVPAVVPPPTTSAMPKPTTPAVAAVVIPTTPAPTTPTVLPTTNAAEPTPVTTEPDGLEQFLPIDEVMNIKRASSSRMNFSANINRRVFGMAERASCNVRGKSGKGMLDKTKVAYIKDITFRMYPLENKESGEKAWNACITAIDEVNRRLNKKK